MAISELRSAGRRARRGGSGLARRASIGGCSRRPRCSRLQSPQVPRARARPEWVGGAALAMLRAPRTLAPATAQPTKSLPTLNPTELWPSGLSSPQLCPATTATTYYTSLYTQTVPSSAALGTCLDATPHGPEGQIVRCVPAGRLPVMLGTPRTSRIRVWVGKEERRCLGRGPA